MRKSRGQALAEFAIVVPVFLLLMMGVVDFGRGIYIYSVISNGAREGARYAIVHGALAQSIDGSCGSGPGTSATTKDTVGSLVVQATGAPVPAWALPLPAGCASPTTVPAIGLDPSQYFATVCWGNDCTTPADCSSAGTNVDAPSNAVDVPVTVRTCYRFNAILPSLLGVGTVNLSAQATLSITH